MFKEIICSKGTIKVHDDGSVYSFNGRLLKGTNVGGYRRVTYAEQHSNNTQKYIHRLVAELFLPNPLNLPQVNHIDGDKTNNNVSNLEWCTSLQNIRHYHSTNERVYTARRKGKTRLTDIQVKDIRNLATTHTYKEIGSMYNLTSLTIYFIVSKRSYKNIT